MKVYRKSIALVVLLTFISMLVMVNPVSVSAAELGNITNFTATSSNTFDITCGTSKVKVIFYTNDMMRIWATPDGTFSSPSPDLMVESYDFPAITVAWADAGSYYKMETSDFVLRAYKSPLTFAMYKKDNTTPVWQESSPLNMGTTTKQSLVRGANENFYGCGMQNGSFTYRDRSVKIDSYIPDFANAAWGAGTVSNAVPFYMSTSGYGAFRNTFQPGQYDFTSTMGLTHNENRFDCFYFYGPTFDKILDGYTKLTGRPALSPIWGLGLGASLYDKNTPDCLTTADKFNSNGMPGAWLNPNDGYGLGYVNLPSVVTEMEKRGFYTGLWTEKSIDPPSEVGTAGTREYKLDVASIGYGKENTVSLAKQAYEGIENNSNARGYVWSCFGWAGIQRYSVSWSGDQYSSWDNIAMHIPTVIGGGLSGLAYSTGDIDGIFGGSGPTYVRDLQWKSFLPAFMAYSYQNDDKLPWYYGEPYTTINRKYLNLNKMLRPYIYTYAEQAYETGSPVARAMVFEYPEDKNTLGTGTQYQFMCGKSLLVAPVYSDTNIRNGIYLPAGNWINYWDGSVYHGSTTLNNYSAPLDTLPLLVKEGAIIPMYNSAIAATSTLKDPITWDIYPSGKSSFTLYEDDGLTKEYKNGRNAKTTVTTDAPSTGVTGNVTVTVGGAVGSYTAMPASRNNILTIHSSVIPSSVILNSNIMTQYSSKSALDASASGWFYDPADRNGILYVKTGVQSTTTSFNVTVNNFRLGGGSQTVPSIPTGIIATAANDSKINVSWNASTGATGYDVFADGAMYSTPSASFSHTEQAGASNHTYQVRAWNSAGASAWSQPITATTYTNVALNKAATADSVQSWNGISNGNDGSTSTRWCASNGKLNHWWQVDLGANYDLSGSEVIWENSGLYQYKIEASKDNANWETVVDKTGNTSITNIQDDSYVKNARYVRITVTGLGTGLWASIREFKVFGNSGILIPHSQMTAAATSQETVNENDSASMAIDDNSSTMWHTQWDSPSLPQSITLNLGGTYNVSELNYLPRQAGIYGRITGYNVYTSTDGTSFTKAASGTWADDKTEKIASFTPVTAAYVKLEATDGNGNCASAAEINVYAADDKSNDVKLPILESITVQTDKNFLNLNNSSKITVTGKMSDESLADLSKAQILYSSDNEQILKVDEEGNLTPIGEGTANIKVSVLINDIIREGTVQIAVDNTAPVTSAKIAGSGSNDWYNSDVTVTLTSKDNLSGVDRTEYKISESGDWIPYNGPVVMKQDGVYKLQYRSMDRAGNTEETKQQIIKIDKTMPCFKLIVNGNDLKNGASFDDYLPLTFKVSDYLSGIASAKIDIGDKEYTIDTTTQQSIDINMAGKLGSFTAQVTLEDAAGNKLETSISFNVTTSINSMIQLVNRYIDSGELTGPIIPQLTNDLKQAQHQLDIGRPDHAAKHIQDFADRLNNKALSYCSSEKAKTVLNADAQYIK